MPPLCRQQRQQSCCTPALPTAEHSGLPALRHPWPSMGQRCSSGQLCSQDTQPPAVLGQPKALPHHRAPRPRAEADGQAVLTAPGNWSMVLQTSESLQESLHHTACQRPPQRLLQKGLSDAGEEGSHQTPCFHSALRRSLFGKGQVHASAPPCPETRLQGSAQGLALHSLLRAEG